MKKRIKLAMLSLLCALFWAQEATTLACTCNVVTTGLNFGAYNPLDGAPARAAGNIQVVCSGLSQEPVSYAIALSAGISGLTTQRHMTGLSGNLRYNLYTEPACIQVWGDGAGDTNIVSDSYLLSGGRETKNYPLYGRIPPSQNVRVGSYSDTITVTVTY